MKSDKPNALIRETSPYLLQHAYNPVGWLAWNEDTLSMARKTGKPLLISIGYAACHWCHVMEKECFEDPEVAEVMNAHFIPVKVDREERPDVDQIYMDALQIMTGSGGWPLNVVALPDGRPFWGATYVPKDKWIQALLQLSQLHREEPEKVRSYAGNLTGAVRKINEMTEEGGNERPGLADLSEWVGSWKPRFDPEYGGQRGAPKFMMPVRLQFLMHWGTAMEDSDILDHVHRSLKSMALGGLFDQLGGGFSRYSVDVRWHVPHFEKMLYDNAQLMGVYAQGYARYGDPLFLETVRQTFRFLESELRGPEGGYFASLDADSTDAAGTLTEGAYYVWREAELKALLGDAFGLFSEAYNINAYGRWEEGSYVLIRKETDEELAGRLGMDVAEVRNQLAKSRSVLLQERSRRERPRLDDKIICSWNALLLSGLADAARYCGIGEAQKAATRLGEYLFSRFLDTEGHLLHSIAKGKAGPRGYLEDYAALIEGCIRLYSCCGDLVWMRRASDLTEFALEHFAAGDQPFFYFTSDQDAALIRKTVEVADNVIPASNSTMAKNLFLLGLFFGKPDWIQRSEAMLERMKPSMDSYSGQYANWMQLALWMEAPFFETAVCGPAARKAGSSLAERYLPHTLLAFSDTEQDLPLFKSRFDPEQTRIYICNRGACQHPLEDTGKALQTLQQALTQG